MFANYIRIAFRNFLKSKVHTAINLLGLTAGMVSIFLIATYVRHELSFDRYLPNSESIYRIDWYNNNPQTRTPHPMAQGLAQNFPEVVAGVSISPLWGPGLTREVHSFRNLAKDERFDEANILAVDTSFFSVFPFKIVKGDGKKALHNLRGILISESTAKRYFGDEDPVGKQLAVDSDTLMVEVAAVFEDVPANSHFHFDILVSYLREKYSDPENSYYSWADFGHFNYIRLQPGADALALQAKLLDWTQQHTGWSEADIKSVKAAGYGFRLTPITDIHLKSHIRWELEPNGNINYVYILASAAFLILLIACVNFVNLTTARSTERGREIGVRKSMGAFRSQLALQFIVESVLISTLALLVSLGLIQIVLPLFANLSGTPIKSLPLSDIGWMALGSVAIAIIAGSYPAFYLSRVKPSEILKGGTASSSSSGVRNLLIVVQFAISMALISGSVIIFNQLGFLQNHNLGYDQHGIVVIPIKAEGFAGLEAMKNELTRLPGVVSASATTNIPSGSFDQHGVFPTESPLEGTDMSECYVDADFIHVMGITLKEGRWFEKGNLADSVRTYVINETAARRLNLEKPVGASITIDEHNRLVRGRVIGVVQDFHFQSLHEPIQPILLALTRRFNYLTVRVEMSSFAETIQQVEQVYRKFEPLFGFEYSFLDDRIQKQYETETRLGTVMGLFAVIAILIASFGLFGMALLSFYKKAKEISVRKVLGAGALQLVVLLLRNFTILVLAAVVIATPFTWWVMDGWLQNFNFRIEISMWIFLGAAASLVAICWLTLSYLTLKTASVNPAETLKSE